ncbi:MAG: hypothetical protein AAGC49_01745 [Brevundimonas sp.]
MARLTGAIVGALLVSLAVAGCSSSSGDEPDVVAAGTTPAVTRSAPAPTASPSAAPTATATPTSAVTDRSDLALGIAFKDIPQVQGEQAEAVDALMRFQVEFWRSRVEGKVSPAVNDLATGEALAQVKDVVATNATDGWTTGGAMSNTFADLASSKHVVLVDVCVDERGATYTKAGKVTSGADLDLARQTYRAEVARQPGGGWAVQMYAPGKSC